MSDTYRQWRSARRRSGISTLFARECGFGHLRLGRAIVTVCVGLDRPRLALLDPHTLRTLAAMPLPLRNPQSGGERLQRLLGRRGTSISTSTTARGLDNDHHILVVLDHERPGFQVTADYDLSGVVHSDEGIISVLPDWRAASGSSRGRRGRHIDRAEAPYGP